MPTRPLPGPPGAAGLPARTLARPVAALVPTAGSVSAAIATVAALTAHGPAFALGASAALLALVGGVLAGMRAYGRRGLGPADGLTLARGALACLIAGTAAAPDLVPGPGPASWLPVAGALAALLLDGLDGPVARRRGEADGFGARFDMEVDALLALALSALAAGLTALGPAVLLLGAPRYLYAAAAAAVPALRRPLPPSSRRRAVCGLQLGALTLLLAPPLTAPGAAPLAAGIALAASAAVAGSFAADAAWCVRRAGERARAP